MRVVNGDGLSSGTAGPVKSSHYETGAASFNELTRLTNDRNFMSLLSANLSWAVAQISRI